MTNKPPTYRERAIDTGAKNTAALRDLLIDLASEIDKLVDSTEPPSTSEDEKTHTTHKTEGN